MLGCGKGGPWDPPPVGGDVAMSLRVAGRGSWAEEKRPPRGLGVAGSQAPSTPHPWRQRGARPPSPPMEQPPGAHGLRGPTR